MDSSQIHPRIPGKWPWATLAKCLQRQTHKATYFLPLSNLGQAYIPTYFLLRSDQAQLLQLGRPNLFRGEETCGLLSYMNSSQQNFRSVCPWVRGSQAGGIFILWISWAQESKLGMFLWLLHFLVLHTSVFKVPAREAAAAAATSPLQTCENEHPEDHPTYTYTFWMSTWSALMDKTMESHYLRLCFPLLST